MADCAYKDDTYYEEIVESDSIDVGSISDLDLWDKDGEFLKCSRNTHGENMCVYHSELTPENHEDKNEKLRSEVSEDTDQPLVIIEGNFDTLILADCDISRPIFLLGSDFNGSLQMENLDVEQQLMLSSIDFLDEVEFSNVDFHGKVSFEDSEFNESSEFSVCTFIENSNFKSARFEDEIIIDRNTFEKGSDFEFAKFNDETKMGSCIYDGEASFYRARFNGETKIARVRDIDRIDAHADIRTKFNSPVDFSNSRFSNGSTLHFELSSDADFHKADIDKCDLRGVDLTSSNLENANLEGSILYGTDLRGCRLMGTEFEGARLNGKTKFLGDPDNDSVEGYDNSITSILSSKRCYYDPNYQYSDHEEKSDEVLRNEARTVYRELQKLGNSTSHSQLQTRAFVHRKDMEKDMYWNDIWSTDSGPSQPVVALARWLRAKMSRIVMLYGESPWRVIMWSVFFIFGFATTYISLGLIETDEGVVQVTLDQLLSDPMTVFSTLAGSIYYSALIFTNLSFGRYSPVGAGTYLTAIETTVGLTMLALFFFVLGRRASK